MNNQQPIKQFKLFDGSTTISKESNTLCEMEKKKIQSKKNPKLIVWDYNREATVTLEDATMTVECLEVMYGELEADKGNNVIVINANKFPGTYAVVGKTWARDIDGVDHVFTFYIPKAKISSESTTISMQAEGDPSVFNMTLEVLRGNEAGDMVQLILDENTAGGTNPAITWNETAGE